MSFWLILLFINLWNLFRILNEPLQNGDFSIFKEYRLYIFLVVFLIFLYYCVVSYVINFGWQYKADNAYKNGDINVALKYYTILIKIFRWNGTYLLFRGNCYYKMSKWQLAINDYTRALKLEPDEGYIYKNRAYAYKMLGFKKNSQSDYAMAKKLGERIK